MISKYMEYNNQVYEAVMVPVGQICFGCDLEDNCKDLSEELVSCTSKSIPADKTIIYKKVKPEEFVEINII